VSRTQQHGEFVQCEPGGHSGGYALWPCPSRPRWVGPSSTVDTVNDGRKREYHSAGSGLRAHLGVFLVYRVVPLLPARAGASTSTIYACVEMRLPPQVIQASDYSTRDPVRSPHVASAQTALKRMIHGPPWSDSFSLRPPSARRPSYALTPLIHDVFSSTALFAPSMLTRTLTARNPAHPRRTRTRLQALRAATVCIYTYARGR
jgi:hypothetical protein